MSTTSVFVTLEHIECANCGVIFGITSLHEKRLRESHDSFFCPMGHSQFFPQKSDVQRLRSQLEQEQARIAGLQAQLQSTENYAEHMRKSRDGMKGALVKAKKRAVAGVCPCCTRTFQNVARHMATKHPEMVGAPPSGEKEGERG